MKVFDAIIIGAGASGLRAALDLGNAGYSVCILEARDRIGGRIHTITDPAFDYPLEAGAEFIHGKLEETFQLIRKANLRYDEVAGDIYQVMKHGGRLEWRKENEFFQRAKELEEALKKPGEDLPLKDFLLTYFPGDKNRAFRKAVTGYATGYDAADPGRFSTLAFKAEMQNEDEENYRLREGYTALMEHLANEAVEHGAVIKLNAVVNHIRHDTDPLQVTTTDDKTYRARQLLVTIPLGVWQARKGSRGAIGFIPDLPGKTTAARRLGFGAVIKFVLQFDGVFWQEKRKNIGFIISDREIPTWWTQAPDEKPMLSGWVGGPDAAALKQLSDAALLEKGLQSLSQVFAMKPAVLKAKLVKARVFNWATDPYARGAYSYQAVNTEQDRRTLQQPIDGKLFFAGEALYPGSEMGTVEAALASGAMAAVEMRAKRVDKLIS